jgi:hypothetical protein
MATLAELVAKVKGQAPAPLPGEPAPASTISWWCWDAPGFKDCHGIAFQAAQGTCAASGLKDDAACIVTQTDALAKTKCGCPSEPPPGAKDPDAAPTALIIGLLAVGAIALFWNPKKKVGS